MNGGEVMGKRKYKTLSQEMMKEITEYVIDCYHEEQEKNKQLRYDKRLRNTKMLLRNYRELVSHSENAIYEASQVEDEDLFDILEMMSSDTGNQYYVESIKISAARTRLIIEHVKEMLALYEIYCNRSPKPEDKRRYRTIYALYIADEPKTYEQIAEEESVEPRTVYRDVSAAVEKLTFLIFGIDGMRG